MLPTLLADEKAKELGHYIDHEAAERVIKFIETYVALSTTNKPFTLLPFQREFITKLFGWKRPDGRRRFTRCLLTSGKKSYGKTVLAAAIGLYLLMADGVNAPMVTLAAVTREQATQLFKEVKFAVDASEFLAERIKQLPSTYRLLYPKRNGELKALSSEAPGKGGFNCSAVIYDEVALAPNAALYEMLKGSMKAREQPLMLLLSNAGWDKGHFYHQDIYKPAKDILEGKSDDTSFLPVVYEVPENFDWKDSRHWPLANPALGSLLSLDAYRDEFNDALRTKAGERWFRRFALNQWTATETTWIDLDKWDACKGDFPSLDDATCYVGIDLSNTLDWTSIVATYPIDGKYYVKSWNFVPKAAMDGREKQNKRDYLEFADKGDLRIVNGDCINFEEIHQCIRDIPGNVRMLIFDKWSALATCQQMEREGYDIMEFTQSHAHYNEPCKMLERWIIERKLVHSGSLAERWCINNCQLDTNAAALVKPTKANDAQKIDFCCALLMSVSQAMLDDGESSSPTLTWV